MRCFGQLALGLLLLAGGSCTRLIGSNTSDANAERAQLSDRGRADGPFGDRDRWSVDGALDLTTSAERVDPSADATRDTAADAAVPSPDADAGPPPATGRWDRTFASGGTHSATGYLNGNSFNALVVDPQGRIYVAGQLQVNAADWGDIIVERLLPSGALDTSFNFTGTLIRNDTPFELAVGIHLTPEGKLRIGGARTTEEDPLVWGLTPEGNADSAFGTNGLVLKGLSGENFPRAMAVDPRDGSFYIVGDDYGDTPFVVKFTSDGRVDTSFSADGHLVLSPAVYGFARGAAVDATGSLVVVGAVRPAGAADDLAAIVWRLAPDGSFDTTFANGGVLLLDDVLEAGVDEDASAVVVDKTGALYLCGHTTRAAVATFTLWKLSAAGQFDGSFGSGGALTVMDLAATGGSGRCSVIQLYRANWLQLGGNASNGTDDDMVLLRMARSGALDPSFGDRGKVLLRDVLGFPGEDRIRAIAVGKDGEIYVAGSAKGADGYNDAVVLKVN